MRDYLAEIPLKWRALMYFAVTLWAVLHKR